MQSANTCYANGLTPIIDGVGHSHTVAPKEDGDAKSIIGNVLWIIQNPSIMRTLKVAGFSHSIKKIKSAAKLFVINDGRAALANVVS